MLSGLEVMNSAGAGSTPPKPCPATLGLVEYRSLCDFLAVTRQTLNKMAKEDGGRQKIMQYTRYATIALCIFQGGYYANMQSWDVWPTPS